MKTEEELPSLSCYSDQDIADEFYWRDLDAYMYDDRSLDNFSDLEILQEYNDRELSHFPDSLSKAEMYWRLGNFKEAMIYFERAFPQFERISEMF